MSTISVLIPTYRRPQELCRCLEALYEQTRPAEQVLVVVRDSDDETRPLLADLTLRINGLQIVTVTVPGVIAAMNAGLSEAKGDIIALTDDDTAPYRDWIEQIEAHFVADPLLGGVGGRDWLAHDRRSHSLVGKIQWYGRIVGNHHLGVGPAREVDILKGANSAYRAKPLKQIGFDKRMLGSGAQVNWELALGLAMRKAGWKLIYDPAVAVDHFAAKRFDNDLNHRGIYNAEGLFNAVYNESLILLTYLSPVRRFAYVGWAFLVGTHAEPGLVQVVRLLMRGDRNIVSRVVATSKGRLHAISNLFRQRLNRKA